jgi:hypothetical protein
MSANPDDYYRAQSIKIRKEYAKEIAEYGVTMRLLSELLFGSMKVQVPLVLLELELLL